ncbi:MAG: hypothetical protein IJL54_12260 [Prevotella sp.]|nr:hypothetical protein [Prevotella sp.]
MKRNHIFRNASVVMVSLMMGAFTVGCSDWDDHYDGDASAIGTAASNLWENISSESDISQFKALLQKAGYDKVLAQPQYYTVWAPKDNTFDYNYYNSLSLDKLQKEFVQNHISRYNYALPNEKNPIVNMLNEKVMPYVSNTISGVNISNSIGTSNGILKKLDGRLPFLYNIYESLEPGEFAIDSICQYFHGYDMKVLDKTKSVQGPVKDGKITYLDSVFNEDNILYNLFYAYVHREDSNYTMLVPTNEAWKKAKEKITPYFNYVNDFTFVENTATNTLRKETKVNIDAAYLRDSMINYMLVQDLFYNNNLFANEALNTLQTGQTLQVDSLVGTNNFWTGRSLVYSEDAANLFEGATRVDKSNGAIFVTDSLRMRTWTTWNPPIKVEAESPTYSQSQNIFNGTGYSTAVTAGTKNPLVQGSVSNNRYMYVQPSATSTNPEIDIYLPHVRSTTYNIYGVFVPENITNENIGVEDLKPNRLRVRVVYNTEQGNTRDVAFSGYVENDPTKVDTVLIGEFTFPIAYEGTGGYYPYLRISSNVTSSQTSRYTREIRLDCLMLIPKELDEYRQAHPGYKYYEGSDTYY